LTACIKRKLYFIQEDVSFDIQASPAEKVPSETSCVALSRTSDAKDAGSSMEEPACDDHKLKLPPSASISIDIAAKSGFVHKKRHEVMHHPDNSKEIVPENKVNYFTLFLIAAFFPPLAVGIKKSFRSWQFFLTVGLTLSFFFPGMVYAVIMMVRENRRENKI
jgi:uncharacterized membrane protein YqaE (UPF0057 family)